ncbi:ATP-binding protein [Pantoea sp.]|uniref:ATP-binding protein n=1 Tax=Pantoea sp. TaxID=69393 RepID=UPI00289C43C7|nr:ATP-binding protein [Pantoea sp.]
MLNVIIRAGIVLWAVFSFHAWSADPCSNRGNLAPPAESSRPYSQNTFLLTPQEKAWIKAHPVVRVVITDSYAPYAFVDNHENFNGISSDLFTIIRIFTGLSFTVSTAENVDDMVSKLTRGQAEMIGAIAPDNRYRDVIAYSNYWQRNDYVMLSARQSDAPQQPGEMKGKKLSVREGSPAAACIRQRYRDVHLVEADNASQAVELLLDGKVSGAVTTLKNAQYQIKNYGEAQLKYTTILPDMQSYLAFGIAKNDPELLSIINKVLDVISNKGIENLNNSWDADKLVEGGSVWRSWHQNFLKITLGSFTFILFSLLWGIYLRKQYLVCKYAKQAISENLRFMNVIMNGVPAPIYVRDRNGILISCNDSYLEALGLEREQVIGRNIQAVPLQHPTAMMFHADYLQVMSEGKPLMGDRTLHFENAAFDKTVFHWIMPYYDGQGAISGVYCGWYDITDRQKLMEALESARVRAEEANKAKSTFLSTMSHELRTPLNAIIGILELTLKNKRQRKSDAELLEVAFDAASGMVELIGDILDISRIESGHLALETEAADIHALTRSVMRIFHGPAMQKQLRLSLSCEGENSAKLRVDPLRYKQILSNLISNALKFTQKGEVKVHLHLQKENEQATRVTVTVTDSGPGITQADQKKLFAPFSQLATPGADARQGAGLGLVISRALCEKMGGKLQLESVPGLGTRVSFTLTLPEAQTIDIDDAGESLDAADAPQSGLRLLIVEDYKPNRILLTQQLKFLGHQVDEATNGEEGYAQWANGGGYDAMIIDCNLPELNGCDLSRRIRQQERAQQLTATVLIGFTANARAEAMEKCLQAGMDDCLFKPVSLDQIVHILEKHCQQTLGAAPAPLEKTHNIRKSVEAMVGGDVQMAHSFLHEVRQQLEQDKQTLAEIASLQDRAALAEMAHKVKGLARILSCQKVAVCCDEIERLAEAQDKRDAFSSEAFRSLESAITAFADNVERICADMAQELAASPST